MENNLIKKLYEQFDKQQVCVYMDEEEYFLFLFHGLCFAYFEDDTFFLSFEVNCDATISAHITQDVIEFAIDHDKEVAVIEPFADVINDEEVITQTLYGEDARHYQETGETPDDDEEIDSEKMLNKILDQISKGGMKSLNKYQKEFLISYAKGKHTH